MLKQKVKDMTYIEFFDKTSTENICSCLINIPERVVLIGDNSKVLKKYSERYEKLFKDRGHNVDFIYRTVNRNNLIDIVEKLSRLVEEYDDCVIDLTGGEDLCLVAAGIVSEKYADKNIQMHRCNIRNNKLVDCDKDGVTIEKEVPKLTVEENIHIYGGAVVYEDVKPQGTYVWDVDEEFHEEINAMWDICKKDVRLWNTQISVFAAAESVRDTKEDVLTTIAPAAAVEDVVESGGGKFVSIGEIVRGLHKAGLLREYSYDGETLKIKYKNMQIKRCLTKAGLALELKVFVTALAVKEDGDAVYSDAMNGVYIDWDGEIDTDTQNYDTENEIDVVMMKGMVPVFVSCKNGRVEMEELYKLNTVADRFGGKYVKKVLIAEALDPDSAFTKYLRQRAFDMGIRLVENIHEKTQAELERTIRSLWCN